MLRPMLPADVPAAAAIETDLFAGEAWSPVQIEAELAGVPATRWYLAAECDGDLVGYVGLFLCPPDADVQTIAVARGSQGRGIGRKLLESSVDHARRNRCTRMFLEVRADNAAALGLYRSVGFEGIGRRSRYYRDGVDAVRMRLRMTGTERSEGGDGDD